MLNSRYKARTPSRVLSVPQVMDPAPSQLAAAVMALLNTLIARSKDSTGVVRLFYQLSYSHWALEAYVIAEANRLTGAFQAPFRTLSIELPLLPGSGTV